nr:unnamed protein product [Digitaria exilis]
MISFTTKVCTKMVEGSNREGKDGGSTVSHSDTHGAALSSPPCGLLRRRLQGACPLLLRCRRPWLPTEPRRVRSSWEGVEEEDVGVVGGNRTRLV